MCYSETMETTNTQTKSQKKQQKSYALYPHQDKCVKLTLENTLGTFSYPTGTGKQVCISNSIIAHIKQKKGFGVYAVMVPRILLGEQLILDIWNNVVNISKLSCSFYSNHSGSNLEVEDAAKKYCAEDMVGVFTDGGTDQNLLREKLEAAGFPTDALKDGKSGIDYRNLTLEITKARDARRPMIIVSTYHSMDSLFAALDRLKMKLSVLYCDEAHNAVAERFHKIHDLPAKKRFYFTATPKNTDGILGMNNEETFGPKLDEMSPAEAIAKNLIVKPRVHFITSREQVTSKSEAAADIQAILAAYVSHHEIVRKNGISGKLLVAARGSKEIKDIMEKTNFFGALRERHTNLRVFDITSAYAPRINGVVVDRSEWLKSVQALTDNDMAIVMHYDILCEGIDVPNMTGVMPLRNLNVIKFMQMLGRATRLHKEDRNKNLKSEEKKKPFAWLLLPSYGEFGEENRATVMTWVRGLREFGWMPEEIMYMTQMGAEPEVEELNDVHQFRKETRSVFNTMFEIIQELESERHALEADERVLELMNNLEKSPFSHK